MNLVFSLGIALQRQTGISGTGQAGRPVNTLRPALAGTVQQGRVLTADTGAWMGNPTGYLRQWRRNGVAILGATAATYLLQAVDVGSTISVAVSAVNAAGTTVATSVESPPVTAAGTDYFVVALQGQSGAKYAIASDVGTPATPFNLTTSYRPAITGSFGRFVDKTGESASGVSLGSGLVDFAINDANYRTPVSGQMVSRGAVAVAQFIKFMAPSKEPVILSLTKEGTSMAEMFDNADTDRYWQSAASAIDYVEATYGPLDLYVHDWFGSEPMDGASNYLNLRGPHWLGELFNGTKHVPGRSVTNGVPPDGGPAVDKYLFDVNPSGAYQGILPYNDGTLKIAFAVHPNQNIDPGVRASINTLMSDPRLAAMSLGTYTIPMSGHADDRNADSPLVAVMTMGVPILKRLGVTVQTPTITGMTANGAGTEITVTVNLPNGGTLTTVRRQRGIAEPTTILANYQPVFGFETADPGAAENTRAALPNATWTADILNSGTGTAPNRVGTVKLTRASAFPTGTKFTYRQGGTGTASLGEPGGGAGAPRVDQAFFNYLIEEVPAWKQSGVEWPFPGVEVAPMDTMTSVSVGGPIVVPLSSVMVTGTTPSIPPGLQVGERVVLLAVSSSATPPSSPGNGWNNSAVNGAGPSGTNLQVSFRLVTKLWAAGDTMPSFTGAVYVEAYRIPASFGIAISPNTYTGTGFAAALSAATAPALHSSLPAGSWQVIHTSARSASHVLIDLASAGFTRIGDIGGSNQRVTWRKGPTASVGAAGPVVMPAAFGPNAGGVFALGFAPQ